VDIIVLKFGGSSVADNEKLKLVANKIINLYKKNHNIVVVLSAQGKTTDKLISEAKELTETTEDREMDALLSTGEQISTAKLSILLNQMGYRAISLTGWQAGIYTNNSNQNAIIKFIDTSRIKKELEEGKIVIIAGFQGVNENMDITTLGRGGSDTTAVAIAAALEAKNCYIFSDVDGVYTTDPNCLKQAQKLSALSYEEMLEISSEGAKVLHNRCIEIGEKFKVPIITKSTFNNKPGTVISDIIEENTIKSIVKKDLSRVSIIGNGIIRNFQSIKKILDIIEKNKLEILEFHVSESKISITFKNQISDIILEEIHEKLIKY
jgi:aspartate kinase